MERRKSWRKDNQPTVLERVRYEIRLDYEASYVNAGLLLIDLKKWREENLGEKIISLQYLRE